MRLRLTLVVLALAALTAAALVAIPAARQQLRQSSPAAAVTAVPAAEDFTWRPISCSGDNVELTVHDAYPGPLSIVYTLTVEPRANSQPVFGPLKPGDNTVIGASLASKLTLTVQVQGGEGAVAILTLDRSAWASLCRTPAAPVTGTGG
jgi:hypothetical protein